MNQINEFKAKKMQMFLDPIPPPRPNIVFNSHLNAYVIGSENLIINGAFYIPNFLTLEEQQKALDIVDSHDFSTVIHRRQQFYGELYYHTTGDKPSIQPESDYNFKHDCHKLSEFDFILDKIKVYEKQNNFEMFTIEPTQVLVNEYIGSMGIFNHFDDTNAFGPDIITISLGQPIWLNLKQPREMNNSCQDIINEIKVLLEPGSLFIMSKDVRYLYKHGISKNTFLYLPNNEYIYKDNKYRRVSLTIRKLLDGRKKVQKENSNER